MFTHSRNIVVFGLALALHASASAQVRLELSLLDEPVVEDRHAASAAEPSRALNIRLGQPLPLRIELINGDQPTRVIPTVDPTDGLTTLSVSGPDDLHFVYTRGRWETKCRAVKPKTLKPGERVVFETALFGRMKEDNAHEYLFAAPGDYEIQAVYEWREPKLKLVSNVVAVSVGPPVDGWDDLVKSGVLTLVEGQESSVAERAAVRERVRAIVTASRAHPLAPWVADRPKKEHGGNDATPKDRQAVQELMERFWAGALSSDPSVSAKYLAADFRRNSAVSKDEFIAKLRQEGRELRGETPAPRAVIRLGTVQRQGTNLVATVHLEFHGDKGAIAPAQTIEIELQPDTTGWLIRRWSRTS